MAYDVPFKLKCIRDFKATNSSISEFSRKQGIPKQTLARWLSLHRKFGKIGLENRKAGAREKPINEGFERLVLEMWRKAKRSAYKMRIDLRKDIRRNGYVISQREIEKIYLKHRLEVKL